MPAGDIYVANAYAVAGAIRKTNKNIQMDLKRKSGVIAGQFAKDARRAARTPQQRVAAGSIKARKTTIIPKVSVGGSAWLPTSSGPVKAGSIWWGSEWGSGNYPWFPEWQGIHRGLWFYKALRINGARYAGLWIAAVDRVLDRDWRN